MDTVSSNVKVKVDKKFVDRLKGLNYELETIKMLFQMDDVSDNVYQRIKKDLIAVKKQYDEVWYEMKKKYDLFKYEKPHFRWNLDFELAEVILITQGEYTGRR